MTRCILILGVLFGNVIFQSGILANSDLDAALHVIATHSEELETGHLSHLESLNERAKLTRAIKLVMDSFRSMSNDTDLASAVYRRFDGLGNNLKHPLWGASLHTERRLLDNSYDDGSSIPRYRGKSGNLLPSARDVSLQCFLPDKETPEYLDKCISQMYMQFGQFLDHDVIFTEVEIGSDCCKDMNEDGTHPDMFTGDACYPIKVSAGDRYFTTTCMAVKRSLGEDVDGVRQQISGVSSYIDASQVYGPSEVLANEMRTYKGGLLNVTSYNGLPELGQLKCLKSSMTTCPHAGDPRVNVFPGLTIIHTLFHREHNRIALELAAQNPNWDDERLYQEARKIVIALNQHITFNEYLPKALGPDMMKLLGLDDPYVYDDSLDASISSVFGAAAFRFGHSQINGELKIKGNEIYDLSDTFFKPHICTNKGEDVIKNLVVNQAKGRAQRTDQFFSKQVTDLLFKDVDAIGESFDLPALAVHRCRDHGLPSYLDYVDLTIKNLAGKLSANQTAIPALNLPLCALSGVYESVDDIDLFVGAMYETPVTDGLVGPTFAYLIGEQFYRLKFGDRFWYETPDSNLGFSQKQLASIKNTSFSHVICRNTIVEEIHPRAMETRRYQDKRPCDTYTDIDFSLWKEEA